MAICPDLGDLFDPGGTDSNLDFDRGSGELPHAPVVVNPSTCFGGRPVIKVTQGQTVNLVLPITDRNGTPIAIDGSVTAGDTPTPPTLGSIPTYDGEPPASAGTPLIYIDSSTGAIMARTAAGTVVLMTITPEDAGVGSLGSESSSEASSAGVLPLFQVRFQAKEDETKVSMRIDKQATLYDGPNGLVQVALDEDDLLRSGLMPAQLTIYNELGTALYQITPYWLHIRPSLNLSRAGSLTLMEVRMVLADACPSQNKLLDALEFSDEEIAIFIRRAVDEFNEKYEPRTTYTCLTFPWRYHWSLATAGYALRAKAIQLERNNLTYSAGGVTVNDDDYANSYQRFAAELLEEWQRFIVSMKRTININDGYATQFSGYADVGYP